MVVRVEAVYEHGVFRPKEPVALEEGTEVSLELHVAEAADAEQARKVAEWLAHIAALPMENEQEGFSGREHDKILYGKKDAR